MFYEPHARPHELLPHDPFKALVAPRPIGWISTLSRDGEPNLAPYSFFNAVCSDPPMLAFSSAGRKDTLTFGDHRGEFVWNLPTYALREGMNLSSAALPRGESEFAHAGVTPAPSRLVAPPRVAESPCALECRVVHRLELVGLDGEETDHHLVIGQVVGVHLADDAIGPDGLVDTAALEPIARCGHRGDYAVVRELFELVRPEAG